MLDINDLEEIKEQLQRIEVITQSINSLMEDIENDISESAQRLRQEIILNRTTLLGSLDRVLNDLEEIKNELQEG